MYKLSELLWHCRDLPESVSATSFINEFDQFFSCKNFLDIPSDTKVECGDFIYLKKAVEGLNLDTTRLDNCTIYDITDSNAKTYQQFIEIANPMQPTQQIPTELSLEISKSDTELENNTLIDE